MSLANIDYNLMNTLETIVASYASFQAVFGTIGNILTCLICIRPRLRKTTTFVFTAFSSIVDIIPLITLNINNALSGFTGYKLTLQNINLESCRWLYFLCYTCLQISAFLLVANSFDRLMSVRMILWRKLYFNSKRAAIVCLSIIFIFILIHIQFTITNNSGLVNRNGTIVMVCALTSQWQIFSQENTYLALIIPFGLLVIFNFLLIFSLIQKTKKIKASKSKSRQKALNIAVIGSTVTFSVLAAPPNIILGYFLFSLSATPYRMVIINFVAALAFSPAAFNLITQLVFNSEFLKEVKFILSRNPTTMTKSTVVTSAI